VALSDQEQIPKEQWCYAENATGKYDEGMKVKPNYWQLTGYRLPRNAEWEYVCRAGTVTAWSCGSDEALLGHYAWTSVNSGGEMHPVGAAKPNGLGLFDMHGNAGQWCQEIFGEREFKDKYNLNINDGRIIHGGSFFMSAQLAGWANPSASPPGSRFNIANGFRVARTYR
jgi:formylglycine-generating enzyme required for sulfatase activity